MKRGLWIGGVLLVMVLWGTMGCGKTEEPGSDRMVDGPGMMYTPEDQTPFQGTWQSRDGSIVMEVESKGTEKHRVISMTGTFDGLTFSHKENAFRIRYSDGSGLRWLTREGAECGEEDVIYSNEPKTPPGKAWSCPACQTENEGNFCTDCGAEKVLTCGKCGWRPAQGRSAPAYCPECGNRLK